MLLVRQEWKISIVLVVYMSLFQITLEGNKTIMAIPKRGMYFT